MKYLTRITATDSMTKFGKGPGSAAPEGGYTWFADIGAASAAYLTGRGSKILKM